jgi:hypothetical protein
LPCSAILLLLAGEFDEIELLAKSPISHLQK